MILWSEENNDCIAAARGASGGDAIMWDVVLFGEIIRHVCSLENAWLLMPEKWLGCCTDQDFSKTRCNKSGAAKLTYTYAVRMSKLLDA